MPPSRLILLATGSHVNAASPPDPNPQSSSELLSGEPLRRIRHDLRHSLYVLDLAFRLLEESRGDEGRFREVLDTLRKERESLQGLIDELLEIAKSKVD
jgi:signal transduction histidine kinase